MVVTLVLGWQIVNTPEPRRGRVARPVRPDGPQEFASFRRLRMADELGNVPADGLMRATAQAAAMRSAAAVGNAGGISRGSWTWIGPGNIGGRIRGLAVHPTSTSTLFAGSVGGGLWKTTNGGTSWAVVDDFMSNIAVSCVVFQPGAPDTMYAGTGEGFYNGDRIQGAGIFKSTNGGTSWSQLASTATADYLYVNRIAISADGTKLLAATSTGLFRSTNGGGSWTKALTPATSFRDVTDVDFLPGSSSLAVASGFQRNIYHSSNGGAGWAASTIPSVGGSTGFNRIELGVATAGVSAAVYAMVDLRTDTTATSTQLWKSTNSGASFSQVSTSPGGYLGGQGWYDNAIWVSPTDTETLIVGGIDLYRSVNGGATFTKISTWFLAPNSPHADHHIIVNDPGYNGTTNTRVYFGNDGGVYKAENVLTATSASGGGFTSLNNNLGVTQFYGAGGNSTSGKVVGGTQDNGTLLYTPAKGAQAWTTVFGGDGGFSAADPSNANYLYGEYINLLIHRSSNGGTSTDGYIHAPNDASCTVAVPVYCLTDAYKGYANFIAPFILDPNTPTRLLAGGASLWRTNDPRTPMTATTGPTWTAIKSPNVSSQPPTTSLISAIAVAPGNSDVIWVGHNNGDVYVTTDGTTAVPTWVKVDGATLPNRFVTRLTAVDSTTAFASFGGFTTNNVWKTVNTGASWNVSSGSGSTALPSAPVYSLVVLPTDANRVYAGTEVGIFASTDGGANWSTPHDGPANVSVAEVFFMGSTLVAATHGRGLFTSTLGDTRMHVDLPASNGTATLPFVVAGWAIDRGASSGVGVDAVHVYAFPNSNGTFGAGTMLGAATLGIARPDVAAAFGGQFASSGFQLAVSPAQLPGGSYRLVAYSRSTITGTFAAEQARDITVQPCTQAMALDSPAANASLGSSFQVAGWAVDRCASSGSGVDAVHVYAFPRVGDAFGGGIFLGAAAYGSARGDVGAVFGSQSINSGFSLGVSGLTVGSYRVVAYARSSVFGAFNQSRSADITVTSLPAMSLDQPAASGTTVNAGQSFIVAGWAVDRGAGSGSGVDAVHIYAFQNTGGAFGAGIFLAAVSATNARPDVGAVFGSPFTASGFNTQVTLPAPGTYRLVAYARSTVSGTFNQEKSADITVQ